MSAAAAGEQFVFGYGSLVGVAAPRPARLEGHRRVWGVAMDNGVDLPGYKCYRRPGGGGRPAVCVAFLDIVEEPESHVDGALLAVDEVALRALDERERNYERVDVTARVPGAPGTIWTYRGSGAGRARLAAARRDGRAVVVRAYLDAVRAGFAALRLDDDADPGELPVVDLERVDLPPAG